MARIGLLIAVVAAGWLAAELGGLDGLEHSTAYVLFSSLLLAIGLYGSTHGIDRAEAREHTRLIVLAVTVGVVLKTAFIAGVVYLVSGDPRALIMAVVVAQIDPLSVASVMKDDRLSARAKTILGAWSSFDDPVTIILAVYAAALVRGSGGGGLSVAYFADLGLNALFALVAYLVWRLVRNAPPVLSYLAAAGAVVSAAWSSLMLGLAAAGLYLRLPDSRWLLRAVSAAFALSAFLMGLLLVGGTSLGMGVLLGLAAFAAQMVAALVLTHGLPVADRVHLGLAQQNGVTAVILALVFERDFGGFVAVVAPAILTINLVHAAANRAADAWGPGRGARGPVPSAPR
ncbi:hypothetical protein Ppa06_40130 [Planomonospora parontospora subsp. parontospora]|uniref:Uncharacterized protein n=2 Tax=Planomonospora parontospora TaxID=58119 RepID=A0AA37F5X3_9ACTN|nr:hypothetical protein [Planomonospora parontospora]GGK79322.1 hypothetical protein GCM10010126_43430 [Planomonospora parontospora]GII10215.1 hypothetical protein Ppa06_40130 [Planomonospora parontospora subsp. parontospora]